MSNRKLGENQIWWLRSVVDHGGTWRDGRGFYWSTSSGTVRLCESLVRRGLMEKIDDRPTYQVTKAGRDYVANLRKECK